MTGYMSTFRLQSVLLFSVCLSDTLAFFWNPPATSGPASDPYLLPLRRETVPVRHKGVVVSHKTSYSGVISIGFPDPQEFRVVFDTGSAMVILPSVECKSKSCAVHRRYNMSASAMAIPTNADGSHVPEGELCDQVTIGFGTGQITGQFVYDKVCLGGSDLPSSGVQPMKWTPPAKRTPKEDEPPTLCSEMHAVMAVEMSTQPFKQFGFDGIMGLGLSALALSKNYSFFNHLVDDRHVSSSYFSVFLTDGEDDDQPEIAFGGHNPQRLLGPLHWSPVANAELGYWQLDILAVRVDGQKLDFCSDGTCRGVMDTGTSHLGIPTPFDKELADLLVRNSGGLPDCRGVKAPMLEIELRSFNITLNPEDYMRPLPLEEGVNVGSAKGVTLDAHEDKPQVEEWKPPAAQVNPTGSSVATEGTAGEVQKYCRARLMPVTLPAPLGPKLFILGEPILHRYYAVFDWASPQIGLGVAMRSRFLDQAGMAKKGLPIRQDVQDLLQQRRDASAKGGVEDEVVFVQLTISVRSRSAC